MYKYSNARFLVLDKAVNGYTEFPFLGLQEDVERRQSRLDGQVAAELVPRG
jgi:hypothetical protein